MKKNSPTIKKDPAAAEAERKRREAEWWNRVIVYYLNQEYHREMDRQVEQNRPQLITEYMINYFREKHAAEKLLAEREKQEGLFAIGFGEFTAVELLEKIDDLGKEQNSPFRELLNDIREDPKATDKIERSLSRCVTEAPQQILARGRRNAVHLRPGRMQDSPPPAAQDPAEAEREHERLRLELTFLRSVAPKHIYRNLCAGLVKQGRLKEGDGDLLPPPPEDGEVTWGEYVVRHQALPREEEGELGNLDELYTSAAYMLAAYEQKDSPLFSEKLADARAMQLSGSKAFRLYMKEHPGSLLAAAQNTGLEATHGDLTALDRELEARDEALGVVRDALRDKSSGQTAAYHRSMNALDRFLSSPEEPSKKERDALALSMAQYVMTEGDPKHPSYRREATLQFTRALQILLPEKGFRKLLETVNEKRSPEEQITPEKLETLAAKLQEAAPEQSPSVNRLERKVP
ncbi:MAG: hypothetical protein IKP17_02140 [Oscillospiraceae bacterium]|nr:hypothetical protein [Oscillospiraceae bacterium]